MSEQTTVTLREVQGIYQGLVPWAVKGNRSPPLIKSRKFLHALQGRPAPNNCAMGHKDIVRDRFDVRNFKVITNHE